MDHEITHIRPVIDDRTNAVIAWTFRLTMTDGEASGFDDIPIPLVSPHVNELVALGCPLDPLNLRPLAAWTRREVLAILDWALTRHPRSIQLYGIVESRRHHHTLSTFSLDQLAEERTERHG